MTTPKLVMVTRSECECFGTGIISETTLDTEKQVYRITVRTCACLHLEVTNDRS